MGEGDQRIREESVDVDKRVSGREDEEGDGDRSGRHERDVIPASWPTRSASKVTENCCGLRSSFNHCELVEGPDEALYPNRT